MITKTEKHYSEKYQSLRKESDRYLTDIKAICGNHFEDYFETATDNQDMRECSDIVSILFNHRIAVRTRKQKYKSFQDLTIRYSLDGNNKTEIDKILSGYGDYFFYCYLTEDEKAIDEYFIVDMKEVRNALKNNKYRVFDNQDGSKLAAIKFHDICIIKVLEFDNN